MQAYFCLDNSPRFKFIELESTDSTNNFLRNYSPVQHTDLTLVSTEYQTSGRGQATHQWESERGQNLLFSFLLRPSYIEATQQFLLSQCIALAVKQALEDFVSPLTIKWPNDIYYGNKKIAGILIENDLLGRSIDKSIIGVGINVNQQIFKSDAPNPVSLAGILGHKVERRFVLERVVAHFRSRLSQLQRREYEDVRMDYEQALYRRGEIHTYTDSAGSFQAELLGVEPGGHLLLRDTDGLERRYAFKEVQYQLAE